MSEHARKRARAVLRGRDDGNIILLPDRSFTGWYRHITLVLVALAYLTGICATERFSTSPPAPSPLPARPAVLALTVPEVRHLLAQLIWPSSSSACRVLAWSWWRRCHQSHASYYHTKRRLKAG
ncbi:MAG TPA: hypothetical protein VFN02_15295 [Ktedonobacteraceae bacterium]|nr:hypothetical protein [Ktedonobacteraceae bacterium]